MEDAQFEEDEFLDDGETTGSRNNRTRLIVLALVVTLALGYMVYAAFPGNALFFMTIDEFMTNEEVQDGRLLRVSGKLVDGSFQRQGNTTLTHFQLADPDSGIGVMRLSASYVGVVPDLFFNPHSEIILEGSYNSEEVFQADNIFVKCPSKYRSIEEELLQQG